MSYKVGQVYLVSGTAFLHHKAEQVDLQSGKFCFTKWGQILKNVAITKCSSTVNIRKRQML